MLTVATVTAPTRADFYRDFIVPARPAIINDYAPWPAFEKWSFSFFKERFAEQTVRLPSGPAKLGRFIEQIEAATPEAPSEYLNQLPLFEEFPSLTDDLSPYPEALEPNWLRSRLLPERWGTRNSFTELFMGSAGAGFSLLHFDQSYVNTYITQIVGDKEFTLFSPEDSPFLYPQAAHKNLSSIGPLAHVDLERFPLFAQARPIRVIVHAGQTLFVPRGVWHVSRLLEPSIAVAMSSANASDWPRFMREFSEDRSSAKQLIKTTVLGAVGLYKRWTD